MTIQMMENNRYREARRQVGKRSARIDFLYLFPAYLLVSLGIILLDILVVREATFFYLPLTFMSIGVLSRLVFGVLMFDRFYDNKERKIERALQQREVHQLATTAD